MSTRTIPHLVNVSELALCMNEPDVRIVDVRWRLGDPTAGARLYAEGHIPGAVFANIDGELASEPGAGGRHPLPSPEAFATLMDRLGIADDTRVIAYDDQGGSNAARLWFLLRYFGHDAVAVLDGGIQVWTAGQSAIETGAPAPRAARAPFHPVVQPHLVLDKPGVVAWLARPGTVLLDARAPERYRGEVEPVDLRAGHIPGAINAPFAENLGSGRFLAPDTLRERYAAFGALTNETAVYCGSGVTACHDLLALAVAGVENARLYAGSWSEWSHDPASPVATG